MQAQGTPVLYSFRRCPYAMRARMAVFISGQRCSLREVVLKDKPEHLLEISPKGTVPVLWLTDGQVIEESREIMDWALAQHDPEGWLMPDPLSREVLIDDNDGHFKHHLDRYKYANRYEGADALTHRTEAEQFIQRLETRLNSQSFLMGPQRSYADIAIAPFVRQFANTDRKWFDTAPYPAVQRWLTTIIEGALFRAVMTKYAQWQPESTGVSFPPVEGVNE